MVALIYSKLGGGIHGAQPMGGLSGITLEGGNLRSMTRLILRNAFSSNGFIRDNKKYVQDSSQNTRKINLNTINNLYNAIKH